VAAPLYHHGQSDPQALFRDARDSILHGVGARQLHLQPLGLNLVVMMVMMLMLMMPMMMMMTMLIILWQLLVHSLIYMFMSLGQPPALRTVMAALGMSPRRVPASVRILMTSLPSTSDQITTKLASISARRYTICRPRPPSPVSHHATDSLLSQRPLKRTPVADG
jgi:hypothetical protein